MGAKPLTVNLTPGSPQFIPENPLPHFNALDPRTSEEYLRAPYRDAVNIPLQELADRVFELPPPGERLEVVGEEPIVEEAIALLTKMGRAAAANFHFEFADKPVLGRLWSPNRHIEDYASRNPHGAAIDLGCGSGRDAVYLAALGWRVHCVDRLPDALDKARLLAARYVTAGTLTFHCIDILRTPVDLEPVDLVYCARFFAPGIPAIAARLLRPDGKLLVHTYSETHSRLHGKPKRSRVLPDDLAALFPPGLWSTQEDKEETEQGACMKCVVARYSPNGE